MVEALFYLMAAGAVLAGVGVLIARSPVMSVMSLLGSFACISVIYLLCGFQFLAATQILVYGGAVMVLFLFVVMLLNLGDLEAAQSFEPLFHSRERIAMCIGTSLALLAALLIAVLRTDFGPVEIVEEGIDDIASMAALMFTRFSIAFEAASVLLLATAVGVMVLAKRNRPGMPIPGAPTANSGSDADAGGTA
ncbi:MAG: NADH-quinone oxidoreductase subunit J [Planctomycetota bacterium]|jgi:NADH-quinone oxidoreductase subunit J